MNGHLGSDKSIRRSVIYGYGFRERCEIRERVPEVELIVAEIICIYFIINFIIQ